MKFHLARPALILASSLALASCGGGGKDTYPVKVTVSNVLYEGLTLTTNGMELAIHKPAKDGDSVVATFPNGLDYGTEYEVVPKGGSVVRASGQLAVAGAQPAHQTCAPVAPPLWYGTAGRTASIESARTPAVEVFYSCAINAYPLSGTVTGLTTDGVTLVLTNGSNSQVAVVGSSTATAPLPFSLRDVPFNTSFGVTVLTQPTGYTCSVANGTGVMDTDREAAKGVTNVAVTCTKNP